MQYEIGSHFAVKNDEDRENQKSTLTYENNVPISPINTAKDTSE